MSEAPYDHAHHAGNPGDVWKHVALLALLAANKREQYTVLDTHAGAGAYRLPADGEWTHGIARLSGDSTGSGAVDRYLARVARDPRGSYPGSPALTRGALGRGDRLVAHETDVQTANLLRATVAADPRCRVIGTSGWDAPTLDGKGRLVVLIDPPYSEKEDWDRAAELVPRAARADRQLLLWYPIKRWTRPNLLLQRIREAGVAYVALDLVWTPVELEKNRMAGAGVLLVGAPRSVLAELHAAAPVLGPALATVDGRWSLRATGQG